MIRSEETSYEVRCLGGRARFGQGPHGVRFILPLDRCDRLLEVELRRGSRGTDHSYIGQPHAERIAGEDRARVIV